MSNEVITNQSSNQNINSNKEADSDVDIVSIDEEEFRNSFEGFVHIGEDYQVDHIPALRRLTAENIRKECYKLYIWWNKDKLSRKEGKICKCNSIVKTYLETAKKVWPSGK